MLIILLLIFKISSIKKGIAYPFLNALYIFVALKGFSSREQNVMNLSRHLYFLFELLQLLQTQDRSQLNNCSTLTRWLFIFHHFALFTLTIAFVLIYEHDDEKVMTRKLKTIILIFWLPVETNKKIFCCFQKLRKWEWVKVLIIILAITHIIPQDNDRWSCTISLKKINPIIYVFKRLIFHIVTFWVKCGKRDNDNEIKLKFLAYFIYFITFSNYSHKLMHE